MNIIKLLNKFFERVNNLEFRQYCGIDIATCDRLKLGEIDAI